MKGTNSIEEENDKIKNPEELLPFDFECLRLSDDKEPEPKINTSSKKNNIQDSFMSFNSNSTNSNSLSSGPQGSQFLCSDISLDQNMLVNRPIPSLNMETSAKIFNQSSDCKSLPSKDVPKMINNPKLAETFPIFQQSHSSNFQLTKKAILTSLKNQKTTIILQKIIMEAKDEMIESIVNELKGEYRNIISDKNGNYFCNDLFRICNQEQRIKILKELHQTLSDDAVNNFASHPIQTLIEFASCEEEYKLILYSFNDYNKLLLASLDPNGSYVIQKIINRIPERFRPDFNLIFVSFISFVSTQKFGIVAVKKFISSTKNEQITAQILNTIRNNFMNLARDKYGNYLIQYLLEKWGKFPEGNEIKELIIKNFKILSQIKYSSFICESFIKIITEEEKMRLLQTLDLNEIKSQNNPYQIKIMNLLGIKINSDNNNNNINFFPNQMQMQLPLSLNNNYMQNNQNFNNSGNQNMNIYGNNNNMNYGNQKRKRK